MRLPATVDPVKLHLVDSRLPNQMITRIAVAADEIDDAKPAGSRPSAASANDIGFQRRFR